MALIVQDDSLLHLTLAKNIFIEQNESFLCFWMMSLQLTKKFRVLMKTLFKIDETFHAHKHAD